MYGKPGGEIFCRPGIQLGTLNRNTIRNAPKSDPVIFVVNPRHNGDFGIRTHLKNPFGPTQAKCPGQRHPAVAHHRHRQFVDDLSGNVFDNHQADRNSYFFRDLPDLRNFFYRDFVFFGDRTFFPGSRNR